LTQTQLWTSHIRLIPKMSDNIRTAGIKPQSNTKTEQLELRQWISNMTDEDILAAITWTEDVSELLPEIERKEHCTFDLQDYKHQLISFLSTTIKNKVVCLRYEMQNRKTEREKIFLHDKMKELQDELNSLQSKQADLIKQNQYHQQYLPSILQEPIPAIIIPTVKTAFTFVNTGPQSTIHLPDNRKINVNWYQADPQNKSQLKEIADKDPTQAPEYLTGFMGASNTPTWYCCLKVNGYHITVSGAPERKQAEYCAANYYLKTILMQSQSQLPRPISKFRVQHQSFAPIDVEQIYVKENTYEKRTSKRKERQIKRRQKLFNDLTNSKEIHKEYGTLSDEALHFVDVLIDRGYSTNLVKVIPPHLLQQVLQNYTKGYGIIPIWQILRMNRAHRTLSFRLSGEYKDLEKLPIPARDPEPGHKIRKEILRIARLTRPQEFIFNIFPVEHQGNVSTKN